MRGSSAIRRRIPNSHCFSTSSGGGRGRGSPFTSNTFGVAPNKPDDSDPPQSDQLPAFGRGRGRGLPTATFPAFSSFISSVQSNTNPIGRGRGTPAADLNAPPPPPPPQNSKLPDNIYSSFSGAGRGKPVEPVRPMASEIENRHLRKAEAVGERIVSERKGVERNVSEKRGESEKKGEAMRPKMSTEEKRAMAMRKLGSGGGRGVGSEGGRGGGRGRERGMLGLDGRGRGRGRGRWSREKDDIAGVSDFAGLDLGDNADGEKFAKRIGLQNMNKLVEGFEEMTGRLFPSPLQDAVLDALDTNLKIEFEEEYLMGEFDKNPELEEKEAMDVRDMLEKLKPFLMAYEGFQSHQEWEEAVEATMKNLPLLHQIVEHYSGPERVTAKTQLDMLESVAKTVPASVPTPIKQFTNRAMLSLQSNPGWGLDKKYQFMDKLVSEVSQHYK